MAINQDRSEELAGLDKTLRQLRDQFNLWWLEDVGLDQVDARVAELKGQYGDAADGPTYDEADNVFNPKQRGMWIRHPSSVS